mmetsp:Transcript_49664/g.129481  ORF Transcript_49664/g.129481 Transcript_49664/m.129481 type:complete len:164 (+) Transcript_49664:44-535(+)
MSPTLPSITPPREPSQPRRSNSAPHERQRVEAILRAARASTRTRQQSTCSLEKESPYTRETALLPQRARSALSHLGRLKSESDSIVDLEDMRAAMKIKLRMTTRASGLAMNEPRSPWQLTLCKMHSNQPGAGPLRARLPSVRDDSPMPSPVLCHRMVAWRRAA